MGRERLLWENDELLQENKQIFQDQIVCGSVCLYRCQWAAKGIQGGLIRGLLPGSKATEDGEFTADGSPDAAAITQVR